MEPSEPKKIPITISAPNPLLTVPHILKQQNFDSTGQTVVNPGHVTLRVLPHAEAPVSAAPVSCGELFPTQNQIRTHVYSEQESDWSKHDIVASVAGLEKKLAQLDSEMRTAAPVEAPIHAVMGQVQDHASILRKHAKLASEATSRHRDTTSLTHQICSQINDTVESHATSLQQFEQDIQRLKTKQKSAVDLTHGICSTLDEKHKSAVGLTHQICSTLDQNLQEHAQRQKSAVALTHQICSALDQDLQDHALQSTELKHDVSRLQQSNVVAHKLLTQILGMIGKHEDVVSKLQDGVPADQIMILDAMVEAFEKTKGKMLTFEKTQQEMQRIIAEFQSGKLTSNATHDSHDIKKRLEKYVQLSQDMDAKLSETVARQQSKIRELDDAHQSSLQKQQRKISELEAKVQELSLQHLNSSQSASIARTTDRDVKLLQHELKHVHALKRDVEAIQQGHDDLKLRDKAYNKDIQSMKSKISAVSDAQQLQDVRLDKTHMHIVDIRRKMEM
jgi:ArsR family metal-binding transcriptional regulator